MSSCHVFCLTTKTLKWNRSVQQNSMDKEMIVDMTEDSRTKYQKEILKTRNLFPQKSKSHVEMCQF